MNLNETLERVFKNIESSAVGTPSEGDLAGLFDDMDLNSAKLGNTVAARNAEIAGIVEREQKLREQIDAIVADLEG